MNNIFHKLITKLILIYRLLTPKWVRHLCRFYPSCSEYMLLSMSKHGTAKGFFKGCYRFCKCHPLSKPQVDHP